MFIRIIYIIYYKYVKLIKIKNGKYYVHWSLLLTGMPYYINIKTVSNYSNLNIVVKYRD